MSIFSSVKSSAFNSSPRIGSLNSGMLNVSASFFKNNFDALCFSPAVCTCYIEIVMKIMTVR